ncbi:hypothetical protein A4A49_11530 [Nicotiana attenuata]|uniref:Uncharacterized protein n=1 Tax=Nicotiana attenuata TaxID=49451 RepID=A0A314KQI1_NICAT|nr:hypothetical protein A4A49_11530 [Nicotiana attenuata]
MTKTNFDAEKQYQSVNVFCRVERGGQYLCNDLYREDICCNVGYLSFEGYSHTSLFSRQKLYRKIVVVSFDYMIDTTL